jgi:hypothetical protein
MANENLSNLGSDVNYFSIIRTGWMVIGYRADLGAQRMRHKGCQEKLALVTRPVA